MLIAIHRNDFFITELLPGVAGEDTFTEEQSSHHDAPLFYHPLPILRARRLVPAETVRVQVPQRAVIRRKCSLVQRYECNCCISRPP